MEDKSHVEKKCILALLVDVWKNLDKCKLIGVFLLSLIMLLIFIICKNNDLLNYLLNLGNDLLGFYIAAYAIIFSLAVDKLNINCKEDGKSPFEVLHATFVFGFLIQFCLTISSSFIDFCNCSEYIKYFFAFWAFYSLFWSINCVLYLYATRTFH